MNIVNNILSEKMKSLLKEQIGKNLISFKYDYHFNEKNTANSAGIEFTFENKTLVLYSDLRFFDILDGEDYSYISIYDESDSEFNEVINYPKKEISIINQKIMDIQIVTDTYHFTNEAKEIDEAFVCDYAIIFILENGKICFEKFDIFENELEIKRMSNNEDFSFFDNSEDFENPELYKTERIRTVNSLKD